MKLFVYGTFKKGFSRNEILDHSEFLGTFITFPQYDLKQASNLPYITNGNYCIEGEIYDIHKKDIQYIDYIEGHPDLYTRKLINIPTLKQVYAYFGNEIIDWHTYNNNEIPIAYEQNNMKVKRYE